MVPEVPWGKTVKHTPRLIGKVRPYTDAHNKRPKGYLSYPLGRFTMPFYFNERISFCIKFID